MSCDDFKHLLHGHFRGELPAADSAAVEAHAASCSECGALMTWAKELSCKEFTEFLNDYVEDALPPERRAVFDHHTELCLDCRNYLQSYRVAMKRSVLAMGRGLDVLGSPVPESLILAVLQAAKGPAKPE